MHETAVAADGSWYVRDEDECVPVIAWKIDDIHEPRPICVGLGLVYAEEFEQHQHRGVYCPVVGGPVSLNGGEE